MESTMRLVTRSVVGHCDSGVSICAGEAKRADSTLTITLVNAKHINVSPEVTLTGTMGKKAWRGPLVEEVTIGVDDVGLR
jgi:hypothetical protein